MIEWGVWPAAVSLAAGVAVLPLIWYVWRLRHRPGGLLWIGVLLCIAVWSLTYGLALLTFDPTHRELLEIPLWLAKTMTAPFVFGFALAYTGRMDTSRRPLLAVFFVTFATAFALISTNGWHGLMWTNYRIDPIYAVAAVQYEIQPTLYLTSSIAYILVGAALVLLLETLLSYGRLFFRQAITLTLAIAIPTIANVLWITGAGPNLDLTAPSFVFTGVLSTYALYREHMFSLHPATRRVADRVAVADLGTAVVIVNRRGLVLGLNPKARALFDVDETEALTEPLTAVTAMDITLEAGEETVVDPHGVRTFRVVVSKFQTTAEETGGYTIAFNDITRQRRRRQRLEVLNRVLRHNLRNDATIIDGNARLIEDDLEGTALDSQVAPRVDEILETSKRLIRASEKARDIAKALPEGEPSHTAVDVNGVLDECRGVLEAHGISGTVTRSLPDDATVTADEQLLRVILENVLENAFVHGGGDATISLEESDAGSTIVVEDSGPGIPDHEIAAIEAAREDPLQHGSGLGLWIVAWGVSALGGIVDFETNGGTRVAIHLPTNGTYPPEP